MEPSPQTEDSSPPNAAPQPSGEPAPPRPRRRRSRRDEPVASDADIAASLRELIVEVRAQNALLKRFLYVLTASVILLALMQYEPIQTVLGTAVQVILVVLMILAVLLTAPMWSRLVVFLTDRVPWLKK